MPLYDAPTHRFSTYTPTATRDAGGGTSIAWTLAQSAVPCIVDTASASTVEMYAQDQIRVSLTVSFKATTLTTSLVRGMKIVADDTSESLHVEGIRSTRAYGNIPAFVYADCSVLL